MSPDALHAAAAGGESAALRTTTPEMLTLALDAMAEAVLVTDAAGGIGYLNAAARRLLGRELEELRGCPAGDTLSFYSERSGRPLADPVGRCLRIGRRVRINHDHTMLHGSAGPVAVEGSVAPLPGRRGAPAGAIVVLREVGAFRTYLQHVAYEATHDGLTRLVNRREFHRRLGRVLDTMTGREEHALLYLDLDRFKALNDACGHAAGDAFLRRAAEAFRTRVRGRDTLARLGGDEFGLLLEHCTEQHAHRVAAELPRALEEIALTATERGFGIGVSVGVYMIRGRRRGIEEVLAGADRACYAAKARRYG